MLELYDGSIDVAALKEKYADLIEELAALDPPEPVALETSLPLREGSE